MADFPTIDNPITTDNIEPNTPGYIDPRLDVDVENIKDCKYRYSFKMIKGSKNISKYTLNFTLPAEFSDATENFTPINGNPLPKLIKVSTNPTTNAVTYCWELNGPKEPFKFSESSFVVDYTGDINKPFFTENVVNWTAEFVFPGGSKDGSKYYTETTKKNCQVLPCCEECNGDTLKTVTLSPCDDQAVVNYNPSVVFQPRGRKISVNLNLPAVCDKKDVVVTFPEEYHEASLKGKKATFEVEIKAIKEKQFPELDDKFASEVSEFETLKELKEDTKKKLLEAKQKEENSKSENKLIEKIVEGSNVDIPEAMIDEQVEEYIKDFEYRLSYQGLNLDGYLKYANTTLEALKESRRADAKKTVKTRLVLEQILMKEKIEVTDEDLEAKFNENNKDNKKSLEEIKKTLSEEQFNYYANSLLLNKLMKFLKDNNTIEVAKKD